MSLQTLPGFGGYSPSWALAPLQMKTGVSNPLPLKERVEPIQSKGAERGRHRSPTGAPYFLPKRSTSASEYMAQQNNVVQGVADVPPRTHERTNNKARELHNNSLSEATVAQEWINAAPADHSFYSKIRKLEQQLEDQTSASSKKARVVLKSAAVVQRRENDPNMAPEKPAYTHVDRRTKTGVLALQQQQAMFHFSATTPKPTTQLEYPNPKSRITPSFVEKTKTDKQHALVDICVSKDLIQGTSKSRADVPPGYTGHIPAIEDYHAKEVDTLREYTRTSAACGASVNARHSEKSPCHTCPPLKSVDLEQTTTGSAGQQGQSYAKEKQMNYGGTHGRKNAVRTFFSAGLSQQDHTLADQFCTRFRPREGLMKLGPNSSHTWISDKELRVRTL